MITRRKKERIVAELRELLADSTSMYFIDFNKLTVEDSINLRTSFRESGITFKIAKNTLIKRVLDDIDDLDVPEEMYVGQTGLAVPGSDPTAVAKVLLKFTEKRDTPRFKGALIEGQFYDETKLKDISKLPTREDMIAGIVGSLHAPVSGIVRAIEDPAKGIVGSVGAVLRDLAYVIEEVAKKKDAA